MLIEDNPMNADMLMRRLARRDFEVQAVGTAREGIEVAKTNAPDIILMDIGLPQMDGLEATRLLKADQETAQIPVIALTAHATLDDREAALAAGCDDYDPKPVKFDRLLEKLFSALSRSNPAA